MVNDHIYCVHKVLVYKSSCGLDIVREEPTMYGCRKATSCYLTTCRSNTVIARGTLLQPIVGQHMYDTGHKDDHATKIANYNL